MDFSERLLRGAEDVVYGQELKERLRGGERINPLDMATMAGRSYDSLVGAPTRSGLKAAYQGENPLKAIYEQFARNPDQAPDFGIVGNALADPFLISGAVKSAMKAAPAAVDSLKGINAVMGEVGAIGDWGDSAEKVKSLIARYGDTEYSNNVARAFQMTEEQGKGMQPYLDLRKSGIRTQQIPNYSSEAKVLGPTDGPLTFWNDPFNWVDMKYGASKRVLEKASGPLEINTGSDLLAHDDYIRAIPQGSTVRFHANTGDAGLPSAKRVAQAIKKLQDTRPDLNIQHVDHGYAGTFARPLEVELNGFRAEMPGWGKEPPNAHLTWDEKAKLIPESSINMDLRKFKPYEPGAEIVPYKNAPDSLMGFRKNGQNKGFNEEKYKFEQPVRVVFKDGTEHVDAIKGLNKKHALERARRNWDGATIEPITNERALELDPNFNGDVVDNVIRGVFGKKR